MSSKQVSRAASTIDPVVARREGTGLHVLNEDEADFIDAAMARFFPGILEAPGASIHLDSRLHIALCPEDSADPCESLATDLYRCAIARTQAYCLQVFDQRFQHLNGRQMDAVLAQLEEATVRSQPARLKSLYERLLNDSTEAFLTMALKKFHS